MPLIQEISSSDVDSIASAVQTIATHAATVEECAQRWMFHLYDNLLDNEDASACVLVRCFRTSRFGNLSTELRDLASASAQGTTLDDATQCLVLLGTAGRDSIWNSRHRSSGHRVIPLLSSEMVARSPMIAQLFRQMGIDVHTVLQSADDLIVEQHQGSLEVFYVPNALGSPHIPAQKEFVEPHNVGSVVGFGGVLPSGSVFAIVIFLGVQVNADVAQRFQPLATVFKTELAKFD